MALPHLPTTYTTSKNIYERSIVDRRNRENEFRQKWLQNATFFKQADLTAAKKKTWESDVSFNDSMNAWKTSHKTETKMLSLQTRKVKLRDLLRQEQDQLEAELRELNEGLSSSRLDDMKDRAGSLKSAREEKRKETAQELLYEHWRTNNPKLKALESELHKKHVVGEWGKQLDMHQQRMAEERRMKEEIERQMEEERLRALEQEEEREQDRLEEARRLKQVQKDQIRELKERELEAQRLKDDEEMLMHNQWQLEELENHRREIERQRKKVEFGRVLLRQHAAALRRRSCVIQQELMEDQKFLERLMAQEEEDRAIQTARRERTKADAAWMKQVVDEQLKLEKQREAELDMLYQDEAARIWEKRESEWARERQARERLMQEVMEERQHQITNKMEVVRQRQEESLQRREELVEELEMMQQMTRRELEEQDELKTARKQELQAQMSTRREQRQGEQLRLNLDLLDDQKAEAEYDELLEQEAARMSVRGYTPKVRAKKQAWM